MFRVIKYFTDLQDNKHPYHEGDTFPREGLTVTPERIKELASKKNRRGVALIKEVKEEIPFAEGEPFAAEKPVEVKEEKKKAPAKRTSKKKG